MTGGGARRRRLPDGKLEAACWCGKKTKRIPASDVREGRTFACNLRCMRMGQGPRGQEK